MNKRKIVKKKKDPGKDSVFRISNSLIFLSALLWGKPYLLAVPPCVGAVSRARPQLMKCSLVVVMTVSARSSLQRETPVSTKKTLSLSQQQRRKNFVSLSAAVKKKTLSLSRQQRRKSLSRSSLPGSAKLPKVMNSHTL